MPQPNSYAAHLKSQPKMGLAAEHYSADCLELYQNAVRETDARIDVPYGNDPTQKLDIFMPRERSEEPLPVLIFFHGGGWSNGTKEWCGFMAQNIVHLPAILVCPSYRLLPTVSYPAPVLDCIEALRWVQDNAADLGASDEAIVVGGHSAGGQIASLIALQPQLRLANGVAAGTLRGCFSVSTTFNRRMVNPAVGEDHIPPGPADAIQPDSPIALATKASLPFLITWGGEEDERLPRTGRQMTSQLKAVGCPVETHEIAGHNHFSMHLELGRPNSRSIKMFGDWLGHVVAMPESRASL